MALAYDELPAGSDLRREYGPGGAVTVTAPAGEPSVAARRATAQATGLASAVLCTASLAALLWVLWPALTRLDTGLRVAAGALFVVFSGGLFLLVWKVWYAAHLDLLTDARRETVVLHADARGLLIESQGPEGARSIEIPTGSALGVRPAGGWRAVETIHCIKIERRDGATLCLLAGRHPAELRWVAATLRQSLGQKDG